MSRATAASMNALSAGVKYVYTFLSTPSWYGAAAATGSSFPASAATAALSSFRNLRRSIAVVLHGAERGAAERSRPLEKTRDHELFTAYACPPSVEPRRSNVKESSAEGPGSCSALPGFLEFMLMRP